jgi:DNA-binding MarR family transcriptional regulator
MTSDLSPQTLFSILNEVGIIEQLSRTQFERALPKGMSLAGFTVLNHFVRLDKVSESPAKLASAFQVTRGAMTNTLQRLAVLGFVEVRPNLDDARSKLVAITPSGRAMRLQCIAQITPKLRG